MDPAKTIGLMLERKGLSERLALAIAHLECVWEDLPEENRFGATPDAGVQYFREHLRANLHDEGLSLEALHHKAGAWLEAMKGNASLGLLLAFVLEVDRALVPFRSNLGFLRKFHKLSQDLGGPLWIWDRPSSLAEDLGIEVETRTAGRKGLTPLKFYSPRLLDWLSSIRYVRSTLPGRQVCIQTLDPQTEAPVREVWSDEALEQDGLHLRIGLFSLRGGFETRFRYTGQIKEQTHKFRARAIEPREPYLDRLRLVLQAASDPERGVHILVLPELAVDQEGRDLIQKELGRRSRTGEGKPPLLTVAGSFHLPGPSGKVGNVCTVFDSSGRVVWSQEKHTPYPAFGIKNPGAFFEETPGGLGPQDTFIEDIERAKTLRVLVSPLGWLTVAICSDLVPFSTGGAAALISLPADWVFIPSMSDKTDQFLEVAREMVRTGKVVCFANAFSVVRGQETPGNGARPPAVLSGKPPALGSFVSVPRCYPVGLWYDEEPASPAGIAEAWIGVEEPGSWEGLIVDLPAVVDASLTEV